MRIELMPSGISHDTIEALESLLEAARAGQITGIACAAYLKGRRYTTATTGACDSQPTYALGMIAVLADELRHMVHHRHPDEPR